MNNFTTAGLCDLYGHTPHFQIAEPLFQAFGSKAAFSGLITTLKVYENDELIADVLSEPAMNRVLVVDGGGSHHCALVDAKLAGLAVANGWQGLLIYGCIRNSAEIAELPISIKALHTYPKNGHKRDYGERDVLITFAGVNFRKDHYLYADADGIIVSETVLS